MKKWIWFVLIAFTLVACGLFNEAQVSTTGSSSDSTSSSSNDPASDEVSPADNALGLEGLNNVTVSDGVILMTPGQDYPTPDLAAAGEAGGSSATETAQFTAVPTVDPASVTMPDGIPLYPGATNIEVPTTEDPTGIGMTYVIFYSQDSADTIIEFYMEKAADADWSLMTSQSEPDDMGLQSQMWMKGTTLLTVQNWEPVDGWIKVQISWMKSQ